MDGQVPDELRVDLHFFEDIPDDYASVVGSFPLTEAAVIEFATTWDPQPFHTDPVAAADSVFGGLVASSAHLFAICSRLFTDHEDRIQVIALLGKDRLRLPNPARAGSVLTYRDPLHRQAGVGEPRGCGDPYPCGHGHR